MGLAPKLYKAQGQELFMKTCKKCGRQRMIDDFLKTKSIFSVDAHTDICVDCIDELLEEQHFNWVYVDKLCQYLDIPFIPKEFEKIHFVNDKAAFALYVNMFFTADYDRLDWGQYFKAFSDLKEKDLIEEELPLVKEEKYNKMRKKWGFNYGEEELIYLEDLYQGIINSQNVNGALSDDQAKKLCKISLNIESRIRENADFDKMLGSYEKLIKAADFTPKNAKNAADFESIGELCKWLEKRGWVAKYYDGATKDVVDETMKDIQNFNRQLYVNETGIGEDIERRVQALKEANDMEHSYDIETESDLDGYDLELYNSVFHDDEDEFNVEVT